MRSEETVHPSGQVYQPCLSHIEEPVISSHFMHELCTDMRLDLYDEVDFSNRFISIPSRMVSDCLLPAMLNAARAFASQRASVARLRAMQHRNAYDIKGSDMVDAAEIITEIMFDRQFRSGPRETCSRQLLCRKVRERINAAAPIVMAIPAMPYKFSCPLKTRGQLPDLAEVNFILGLYEMVAAVETIYSEIRPDLPLPLSRFTIISDGSRFNNLTSEPVAVLDEYKQATLEWISRLQLNSYIELLDYRDLLHCRLPQVALDMKQTLYENARHHYGELMWSIFDPSDMQATLSAAIRRDPEPEATHPEGRFVPLMKSLVFTVRYHALNRYWRLSARQFRHLYREMTAHLFEAFAAVSGEELRQGALHTTNSDGFPSDSVALEHLRQEMLREVWAATIGYMAEIKSDRDQQEDPIARCLPDHLRWTIHPKPGQLGLLIPKALGRSVPAWAGTAVFTRTRQGGVRLSTLPVLALEGAGAIPVGYADAEAASHQPLFYIYPDVSFTNIGAFIADLGSLLVRKRAS